MRSSPAVNTYVLQLPAAGAAAVRAAVEPEALADSSIGLDAAEVHSTAGGDIRPMPPPASTAVAASV